MLSLPTIFIGVIIYFSSISCLILSGSVLIVGILLYFVLEYTRKHKLCDFVPYHSYHEHSDSSMRSRGNSSIGIGSSSSSSIVGESTGLLFNDNGVSNYAAVNNIELSHILSHSHESDGTGQTDSHMDINMGINTNIDIDGDADDSNINNVYMYIQKCIYV